MTVRMDEAEQQIVIQEIKLWKIIKMKKNRETKAKDHDMRLKELSDLLKRNKPLYHSSPRR